MKLSKDKNDVYILDDAMVKYLNNLNSVDLFPSELRPPSLNEKVAIIKRDETGGKCAVAISTILKGETICYNDATRINRPIKYSWQISEHVHLIGPGALDHNCDKPTCIVNSQNNFVASRDIEKGELLTFNYLTTEYDMNVEFQCICGEQKCFSSIKGYKYLSNEDKDYVKSNFGISNYLVSMSE